MKQALLKFGEVISIVCLLFFIVFVSSGEKINNQSAEEIGQKSVSVMDSEGLINRDSLHIKKQYGIDTAVVNSFFYYSSDDNMDVRELLIIKVNQSGDEDNIITAVNSKLSDKKTLFESYAPEQSALLKNAVLVYKEGFVFYCVGKDADTVYSKFISEL